MLTVTSSPPLGYLFSIISLGILGSLLKLFIIVFKVKNYIILLLFPHIVSYMWLHMRQSLSINVISGVLRKYSVGDNNE